MKNTKGIIKIVLLAALLVLLFNPSLNMFLSEGTAGAVAAELQANFGILAGGTGSAGIFTPAKIITVIAVVIFMWLACTVVCFAAEKIARGKRRSETVAGLMVSVVKTLSAVLAVVWVLNVIGVNLAAIFASLGIASLILGFGVQSLIEDCVTGIFIIFEGRYNIGDVIILDNFRGTVKKITMRTTTIVDAGGNLKIINNSDIRNVQNRSNMPSYAICDIGISYDADIREVESMILPELDGIFERNKDVFIAVPEYYGVQLLDASSVVLRFVALTDEAKFFPAQRRLNREMKILFDDKGIEIPFTQIVVHNAN